MKDALNTEFCQNIEVNDINSFFSQNRDKPEILAKQLNEYAKSNRLALHNQLFNLIYFDIDCLLKLYNFIEVHEDQYDRLSKSQFEPLITVTGYTQQDLRNSAPCVGKKYDIKANDGFWFEGGITIIEGNKITLSEVNGDRIAILDLNKDSSRFVEHGLITGESLISFYNQDLPKIAKCFDFVIPNDPLLTAKYNLTPGPVKRAEIVEYTSTQMHIQFKDNKKQAVNWWVNTYDCLHVHHQYAAAKSDYLNSLIKSDKKIKNKNGINYLKLTAKEREVLKNPNKNACDIKSVDSLSDYQHIDYSNFSYNKNKDVVSLSFSPPSALKSMLSESLLNLDKTLMVSDTCGYITFSLTLDRKNVKQVLDILFPDTLLSENEKNIKQYFIKRFDKGYAFGPCAFFSKDRTKNNMLFTAFKELCNDFLASEKGSLKGNKQNRQLGVDELKGRSSQRLYNILRPIPAM